MFQASRTANSCTQMRHGTSRYFLGRFSFHIRQPAIGASVHRPFMHAQGVVQAEAHHRVFFCTAQIVDVLAGAPRPADRFGPSHAGLPASVVYRRPRNPSGRALTPVSARGAGATGNSPLLQPDRTIAGCACRAHRQRPRPEPHSPINGCPCSWADSGLPLLMAASRRHYLKGTFESRKSIEFFCADSNATEPYKFSQDCITYASPHITRQSLPYGWG